METSRYIKRDNDRSFYLNKFKVTPELVKDDFFQDFLDTAKKVSTGLPDQESLIPYLISYNKDPDNPYKYTRRVVLGTPSRSKFLALVPTEDNKFTPKFVPLSQLKRDYGIQISLRTEQHLFSTTSSVSLVDSGKYIDKDTGRAISDLRADTYLNFLDYYLEREKSKPYLREAAEIDTLNIPVYEQPLNIDGQKVPVTRFVEGAFEGPGYQPEEIQPAKHKAFDCLKDLEPKEKSNVIDITQYMPKTTPHRSGRK